MRRTARSARVSRLSVSYDYGVTYILEIQLTGKFFSKDFDYKLQNKYLTPYFTSFHLTFAKLSWKFLSFFLNSLNVISTSPPCKGSSQIWLVPDFMNIHDKNTVICNKEQRHIQNSVKHLRWSFLLKAVNYIYKKLHFGYLTRL